MPETKEPKRRGPKPLPPDKLKHRQVLYITDAEFEKVKELISNLRTEPSAEK